jgi:hypothetical protein
VLLEVDVGSNSNRHCVCPNAESKYGNTRRDGSAWRSSTVTTKSVGKRDVALVGTACKSPSNPVAASVGCSHLPLSPLVGGTPETKSLYPRERMSKSQGCPAARAGEFGTAAGRASPLLLLLGAVSKVGARGIDCGAPKRHQLRRYGQAVRRRDAWTLNFWMVSRDIGTISVTSNAMLRRQMMEDASARSSVEVAGEGAMSAGYVNRTNDSVGVTRSDGGEAGYKKVGTIRPVERGVVWAIGQSGMLEEF